MDNENSRIKKKVENHIKVYTKHAINGYRTELTLSGEFSGTKRLFGLQLFIARSLVVGITLVVDELDAKVIRHCCVM